MPTLLFLPTLLLLAYSKPDVVLYNTQVKNLADILLTQCIPDYRARNIPVIICYQLHDRFIKDNSR